MSARTLRPSYAAPTLELYPDEVDVPLPYDETPETLPVLPEVDRLRIALAEALTYVETCKPAPGNRVRAWRELVPTAPGVDRTETPWDRAIDGTLRAAAKWTQEEAAAVDQAIRDVAHRKRSSVDPGLRSWAIDDGWVDLEFTAADVWAELGPGFTVTKGLAGRLIAAAHAGLIANTGRTTIAPKDAPGPNHGQRLTVWRAL